MYTGFQFAANFIYDLPARTSVLKARALRFSKPSQDHTSSYSNIVLNRFVFCLTVVISHVISDVLH